MGKNSMKCKKSATFSSDFAKLTSESYSTQEIKLKRYFKHVSSSIHCLGPIITCQNLRFCKYVGHFVTCQNLRFCKYVGHFVCLFVCLSVCLSVCLPFTQKVFSRSSPNLVHTCTYNQGRSLLLLVVMTSLLTS